MDVDTVSIKLYSLNRSIQEKMATGYNTDGSVALLYDLGWADPAGQMYSSTRDLDIVSV